MQCYQEKSSDLSFEQGFKSLVWIVGLISVLLSFIRRQVKVGALQAKLQGKEKEKQEICSSKQRRTSREEEDELHEAMNATTTGKGEEKTSHWKSY